MEGGVNMEWASQLVTLGAVLLGGAAGYLTNYLTERGRFRQSLLTRWDALKLDAYVEYIAQVRACIYAAVLLFEVETGIRNTGQARATLMQNLVDAEGQRALAFERVMLLAGETVIRTAHVVNRAEMEIDWRARGLTGGTVDEWRSLHSSAFAAINKFHQSAREDLGVRGKFASEEHSKLGLNLPE